MKRIFLVCVMLGLWPAPAGLAQSLQILLPTSYTVVQRGQNGLGRIAIEGRLTGAASAIEARFAGGPWEVIDASPTPSAFAGVLHLQPVGHGVLEVRFANQPGVIGAVANVAVGDLYLITGQSNAEGQGYTLNKFDATLPTFASAFREGVDAWAIADDPVCANGKGSPWPLLANSIVALTGVPVGFISVTQSAESILQWQPGGTVHPRVFGQLDKATRGAMRIKAVLWFQGANDMLASTPAKPTLNGDRAAYSAALKGFANEVGLLPGAPKVVVGQSDVNWSAELGLDSIDNIRAAQSDLWYDATANVLSGPVTYDIDVVGMSDGLHFKTDAQIQTFAARWWAAVRQHFYGGGDGIGPQLVSASNLGEKILLTFEDATLPLMPGMGLGGFTIEDGPVSCTCLSAQVMSGNQVLLSVPGPFSAQATVSLGRDITAWNQPLLVDSSQPALPAVPFLRVPIQ